ncbi:hypothetical protein GXP71_05595 [Cellulomonas sp. H30R-01]|uniref:LuxR C-terminal-related transcriptional regulator n=1 Tax=Cellulomonas sp. H30R-01 TaxID=2704467 RepID=UPI00138C49CB|nr:LuxR C-terminal-related transcriptional regulator [Cellulomonas sp. H30R-01]QHT55612.1 hypothetical protein GXP71_05595 [Cellulomonas sp. H30R-01]
MAALLERQLAAPAFRVPLVRRPTLVRTLDEAAASSPLTLVSAPAGTGKTALLASWWGSARATSGTAWLSVEPGDDDGGRFWPYVAAALARAGVDAASRRAAAPDPVVRLAVALTGAPSAVVLVVDGGHLLAPGTVDDLDRLVRLADGRLRLVLATRLTPLPQVLARRLAGEVVELGRPDLALTEAEVADACHGAGVPTVDAAALADRTEGWAAAVRFGVRSAVRADGRATPGAAAWAGVDGDFAAWFSSHVLDASPADVRDALLRGAVAERLRPGLFDALVGGPSGTLFTQLVRSGAFARPLGGVDEFHHGPLVGPLLRAGLATRAADAVPDLHVTAARWCAEHGSTAEALDHARAAGRWREVTAAVVGQTSFGVLVAGPADASPTLGSALAAVPPDAAHEPTVLARAAGSLLRGDVDAAQHVLAARAGARPDAPGPLVARHRALLELAVARARGDVAAGLAAVARVQEACAADGARDADTARVLVRVLADEAELHAWSGDLVRARRAWVRGAAVADEAGDPALGEPCRAGLALLEATSGDLRRASRLAALPRDADPATPRSPAAHVALAWVATEHVDLRAARRHVGRAGDAVTAPTAAVLAVVRARVLRLTGHVAEARRVLRRAVEAHEAPPAWLAGRLTAERAACDDLDDVVTDGTGSPPPDGLDAALARARARLAHGDTARDPAFVDALGHAGAPLDSRVTGWLLEAERLLALGQTRPATAALRHALHLAGRERLRRPFVEAHPRVLHLLRSEPRLADAGRWLDGTGGLLDGADDVPTGTATAPGTRRLYPVEPLTARERETLDHLAALLSTEETALSMGVSVNTVRTHVRHILAKLSASGRNEAIRRARDLNLLSA